MSGSGCSDVETQGISVKGAYGVRVMKVKTLAR